MRVLIWFCFGLGLALLEGWVRWRFAAVPDPRVLVAAFLLLRTDRHCMASRVVGLALAAPAFDADPPGLWLGALALAALALFPIRRTIRVDHPLSVLFATGVVLLCMGSVRFLAVSWGSAPVIDSSRWGSHLLTLVAAPIFSGALVAGSRWFPLAKVVAPNPSDQLFVRDNSFRERVRR